MNDTNLQDGNDCNECDNYERVIAARDAEIARLNEKVTRTVIGHNDCANELIGTREENEQLKAQLARIQSLVDAQAEDEGLWFKPVYVTEHIFQVALRELHAAIEDK